MIPVAAPAPDPLDAHALALLLAGRCPRCAERLTGGTALRGRPCPACSAPVAAAPEDRAAVRSTLASRSALRLWIAVSAAAVATILGWLPFLASVLLLASLLWIRLSIVRPALRLLSAGRRAVTRWTLRLSGAAYLALSVVALEVLTVMPVVGVAAKAVLVGLQVGFAGWFARRYTGWQVDREIAGAPVAGWEHVAIGLAALALLGSVATLLYGLYWLASELAALAHLGDALRMK